MSGMVGVALIVLFCAAGDDQKNESPRDVTLMGKVVDLHSVMMGKFESSDKVKCTRDCIRAGVPAALETENGLILIGEGTKGAAKTLAPLAFQDVELKGKLYERYGIRYIDITSAKAARTEREPEPEAERPWSPDPNELGSGACCLPSGTCVETDQGDCQKRNGTFYGDWTCDDVNCEESEP